MPGYVDKFVALKFYGFCDSTMDHGEHGFAGGVSVDFFGQARGVCAHANVRGFYQTDVSTKAHLDVYASLLV